MTGIKMKVAQRSARDDASKRSVSELGMPPPPLGSLAIQTPVPTQTIHVTASTCHNISLFKGTLCGYFSQSPRLTVFPGQIS
jgi:hypothetical protein